MKTIETNHAISDSERARIIFAGDVVIYKNIAPMHELINECCKLLDNALGGLDPTTAQAQLDPKTFITITAKAQETFRRDERYKTLFFRALEACGVDASKTYYDHFPLRIVPYGDTHGGARNSFISPHRDSWGSNIHSQINWWAPIFKLRANRSIAIYPKYWSQPIANNTTDWRFAKHMESRRTTPAGLKAPYPSAPSPSEPIDESDAISLMLEPGDILSFSSAHLHGSVPNTSNRTRYSVEMRTINHADLLSGREAPNVDNAGTELMYQWFKQISDKKTCLATVASDKAT